MKPIPLSSFDPWDHVYVLAGSQLHVVVAAGIGRIVHLGLPGQPNLLHADAAESGEVPAPDEYRPWQNHGGDWLWPVARERWAETAGSDWPPPQFLAETAWSGNAWKSDDDALHSQMIHDYPAPLSVRVIRQVTVAPNQARVSVFQRIERTAPSTLPVCLLQHSRILDPDYAVLPTDPLSRFDRRIRLLLGSVTETTVRRFGRTVWIRPPGTLDVKLGTDSQQHWAGAVKSGVMIVAQAVPDSTAGVYPDRGCRAEVYFNSGLGYAEIETLSVEARLRVGQEIENTVHLTVHRLPEAQPLSETAAWVDAHLFPAEVPENGEE